MDDATAPGQGQDNGDQHRRDEEVSGELAHHVREPWSIDQNLPVLDVVHEVR